MIVVKIEISSSRKYMVSNHEEYSNDITLEHLKRSVKICWGFK